MATTIRSDFADSVSFPGEAIILQLKKQQHSTKYRDFNFKPLMNLVEDIFHHSLFSSSGSIGQQKGSEELSPGSTNPTVLQTHLRSTIHRLVLEVRCKCSHRKDVHETTLVLLDLLNEYSWDGKVVLTLSALAMAYGEFWVTTAQPILFPGNPLLQSLSILKQSPSLPKLITQTSSSSTAAETQMKSRLEALKILVKQMLDVANYIIELKDHKTHHNVDEMLMEEAVQLAASLIIASVVCCISSNTALLEINTDKQSYSTTLEIDIQLFKKFHQMLAPCHEYLHEQLQSTPHHHKGNGDKRRAPRPQDNPRASKTLKTNETVLNQPRRQQSHMHATLKQPRWRF